MFKGRSLLLATKHKKESVIAPIIQESLGVKCFVAENFDTDAFGTFTGEVERKEDPITTARNKCLKAMELYNCDLAIASEGSFGPHPSLYYVSADEENLILIDKKNSLEIIVREISTETNFDGRQIQAEHQLVRLAEEVRFPSHALIIRRSKEDCGEAIKGITDWEQLRDAFHQLREKYGMVYLETNMRAMLNPTRMNVIGKAAQRLVEKINSCCPQCSA